MLANSLNPEFYKDWLAHIVDSETKDAFIYIAGYAACLSDYNCHPQFKGKNGPVRDFRFIDAEGKLPFAFIVNQQWLLFYLRKPAISSGRYTLETIKSTFPSVTKNESGEWTIKIKSLPDAKLLTRILGLK